MKSFVKDCLLKIEEKGKFFMSTIEEAIIMITNAYFKVKLLLCIKNNSWCAINYSLQKTTIYRAQCTNKRRRGEIKIFKRI